MEVRRQPLLLKAKELGGDTLAEKRKENRENGKM
jgi:hypothetical protein